MQKTSFVPTGETQCRELKVLIHIKSIRCLLSGSQLTRRFEDGRDTPCHDSAMEFSETLSSLTQSPRPDSFSLISTIPSTMGPN